MKSERPFSRFPINEPLGKKGWTDKIIAAIRKFSGYYPGSFEWWLDQPNQAAVEKNKRFKK